MGKVAAELADVTIVTSDNPRSEEPLAIIQDVLQGTGVDVEIDPDRRSAIARAIALAEEGDVVVIAGKGHEQGQDVAGVVTPFDDREVARERAARRRRDPDRARARSRGSTSARSRADGADDHGVTADSREVVPGDLFVALNTGVRYVDDARGTRCGARSCLATRRRRWRRSRALVRARRRRAVVAVVGSAGKTTTKDILGALCAPHAPTIWAERSLNNEIGLPLTVCRLELETRGPGHGDGHARARVRSAALCAIAQPEHRRRPAHRPRAPRAARHGRARRARRTPRRSRRCRPAERRSCPSRAEELEPYLDSRRHHLPTLRPRRRRARGTAGRASRSVTTRSSSSCRSRSAISRVNTLAALHAYAALGLPLDRAHEGVGGIRLSPWRGEEIAAARGRLRRERRLQREPGLDARGARASRGARRREAPDRDPGRDGRARRRVRRRITARSARSRPTSAIEVIGVGERGPRVRAGRLGGRRRPTRSMLARSWIRARRRRPREGVARGRARRHRRRDRELRPSMVPVLIAGLIAMVAAVVIGPKFIEVLRARNLGQQIRAEGPGDTRREAGHADDGRSPDHRVGGRPVPRSSRSTRPRG